MNSKQFHKALVKKLEEAAILALIVKGNKFQAAKAAADHSIPAAFVRETQHGETVLHVGQQHLDKVAAWFAEPGSAPYPAGSLLHYGDGLLAGNLQVLDKP